MNISKRNMKRAVDIKVIPNIVGEGKHIYLSLENGYTVSIVPEWENSYFYEIGILDDSLGYRDFNTTLLPRHYPQSMVGDSVIRYLTSSEVNKWIHNISKVKRGRY